MGNHQIANVETVHNLGVLINNDLSMVHFYPSKIISITFQLRTLRRIRLFLTNSACKILIQATIQSRLDCCVSLLYGISEQNIQKLCCLIYFEYSSPCLCNTTKETTALASNKTKNHFYDTDFLFKCLHSVTYMGTI